METVVLPAQDHLAQERYRQQGGVMSGIIYPLGGLPRTRRKVRSPQQVFVAASLHSDIARSSDRSNVHVADSRSGLISPMDMSLGILRSAPSSASTSRLPPLSVLKAPQYRLNNTVQHRFISHESSSKKLQQQQQLATSLSAQTAVVNSMSVGPRQILRTRSDGVLGELLQQQGLKRGVEDRKKALEKGAESSKNYTEKSFEKNAEKSSDRRKGQDRRPAEKKLIAGTNSGQGDKSSNVQKKAGVIAILQRPHTKEAAAENIALFTGRPIEHVTKQIFQSAQVMSQHVGNQTATDVELVKDVEASGKDGEIDHVQSKSSRNVSPKKGTKKKPSRDSSAKVASRAVAAEGAQVESRRNQDFEVYGEPRRPRTAPRPAEDAPLERRRSEDTERISDGHEIHVELDESTEQYLDEFLKSIDRELNPSRVSPSSVDQITPSWRHDGVSTAPGDLHRALSDPLVGEIGHDSAGQGLIGRSSSFRDVSRGTDNGVELFFLPSSPPKPSERWAGPAYTNSPPPSTLPFPTFPLQRVKTSMTEVTLADVALRGLQDTNLETVSSSPPRVASLLLSATAMQSPFVDPSSATKDLRRMLNLDVEDSFDVSAEGIEGGVESATQSLKRMLQLG